MIHDTEVPSRYYSQRQKTYYPEYDETDLVVMIIYSIL